MVTTERAQKLLSYGDTPFLTTEEVCFIAKVKPVTLRQWITRGHVELRFSPRVKTGKAMLFSFHDLVEIMAFASLSRLGLPPNRFSGSLASVLMSRAFQYLQDIAGVWGDYSKRSKQERNYQRYLITFHDPSHDDLEWFITSRPEPDWETFDGVWITLDSHLLMERTIQGLEASKQQKKDKK